MGLVYLARQEEPIGRQVAVKVIKLGMDSREVMARFNAERQALAMMNHPGIAQVYEAGVTPEGRPYFSMEYVEGLPITEYCDQHRLTIPERLELFSQVCLAVQHAHQKGVIHRDLKPSNVLVTVAEGAPRPKIIDFGLAAALDSALSLSGGVTRQGALIGTPEYMSPEQAAGKPADTRSDIYSLGLMFFELLTGTLPLDLEALREAPPDELLRAIRNKRAPTPRRRLASTGLDIETISQARKLSAADLRAMLRGELQWIAARALEKDPARRYASASEFAADVSNYLTGDTRQRRAGQRHLPPQEVRLAPSRWCCRGVGDRRVHHCRGDCRIRTPRPGGVGQGGCRSQPIYGSHQRGRPQHRCRRSG